MGTRRNYQRTSNKNDSPLHVLPVAERLIDYTLNLTDNANRFPKRVRFSITNKIQGHVMAIYDDLLEANEIFPIRTEADRTERLRLQRTALTECKKLLHMIELSKKRTYIDKDTFDYWTKLTLDVKFMTAKWYKVEKAKNLKTEYPNKGGHFLPKCRKGHGKHKIDDEWPSYCDGRTVSVKEDFYFERRPDIDSF